MAHTNPIDVLVAEPTSPATAAFKKFLEKVAVVRTAFFLDEALQQVRVRPPEVLIAAVNASFDGEVLAIQARRLAPTIAVVLVYLPEEELAQSRAQAAGAESFVVGPLKKPAVLAAVHGAFTQRALKLALEAREAQLKDFQTGYRTLEAEQLHLRSEVARLLTETERLEKGSQQLKAELAQRSQPTPLPQARPPTTGVNAVDEAFFKKYMLLEVKRSRRYQYPVSLLLMALDGLESTGPAAEAEAQRAALRSEVLGVVAGLVRDIDVAMPFGEDRYLVFMPHTPRAGALTAANRLLDKLNKLASWPSGTASLGLASFDPRLAPGVQVSFGALVREASASLKKAQEAGGGRVELAPMPEVAKRDRISLG